MAGRRTIMCYGDSLTWGWIPVEAGAPSSRYPYEQRWPGVMAAALGEGYRIIEEGLSARTTSVDDPIDPRLNGANYLPAALASHMPLDLVIVMLGTNDTKAVYRRSTHDIVQGVAKLVAQIMGSAGGVGTLYPAPKTLVVAPPPIKRIGIPWFEYALEGAEEKTKGFAAQYEAMATFMGAAFLDAGSVITADGVDGIHFTADNNADLGKAIAAKVKQIV